MELDLIVKGMKEIIKTNKLETNDNILFDCAVRVFNASKMNKSDIKKEEKKDFIATEKQRALLNKMKIEFVDDDTLMSSDVQKLIEDNKKAKKTETKEEKPYL